MYKDVIYVDENDNEVGPGPAYDAISKDVAVRIVRIFITNPKGEMLIQKRSNKVNCANMWDQSAAGHVDVGDTYDEAATRELEEEMGVKNVELIRLTKYFVKEKVDDTTRKRFNTVYMGEYDGEVIIDQDEVSDYRWIKLDQLTEDIKSNPNDYTEGFRFAYKKYITEVES